MPNLNTLLSAEREKRSQIHIFAHFEILNIFQQNPTFDRLKWGAEEEFLPSANQKIDIKIETNETKVQAQEN